MSAPVRPSTKSAPYDGPPISFVDDTLRTDRPARRDAVSPSGYRPDIQGLRAVAVLLVVVDHLFSHPIGGFVGVDVFFVISGFLITGVLLRRTATRGRVSFSAFYLARARRILPASLLVLAACWLTAHLVFEGARTHDNVVDIGWALIFLANVHFQRLGTDYFQAHAAPSLVQHYWSLAVEEQFYLVWPVVILLVLTGTRRVIRSARARLLLLLAVLSAASIASFVYALHQTSANPSSAYFSTVSRAWELGVGALLAVALEVFTTLPQRLGRLSGPLCALGLAGILLAAFVVRPSPGFPAPSGALPVLATALVLFAGAGGPARGWSAPLTNRVGVYVGLVSYSLYLWHWPVIVCLHALVPRGGWAFYATTILAMTALTIFSYHAVESPLRDRAFRRTVEGGSGREARPGRALLAAATAAVLAAGCYALRPLPVSPSYADSASTLGALSTGDPNVVAAPASLRRGIDLALDASAFPTLKPGADGLGLPAAENDWRGCNSDTQVLASCTFHPTTGTASASKVALVLGDSIALAWLPAIKEALLARGWTIYGMARQQCTAADAPQVALTTAQAAGCNRLHTAYAKTVAALRPTLVIMSGIESAANNFADKSRGSAALVEYRTAMTRTMKIFTAPGRKIVNLAPPPAGKALLDCKTAGATPADCVSSISKVWQQRSEADAAVAAQTRTTYLDTHLWFCNANGFCPSFIGDTAVRYDDTHLTARFAASLGDQLAKALPVKA